MTTLDEAEARARRQLDGMTVNRDAMARDVLDLVAAIRSIQARAARGQRSTNTASDGSFEATFDELFGNIFGTGKGRT